MEVAAAVGPEEQHELVRQLQFPPGYHFVPTEQELVEVYLRGKIEGQRPPLDVVNEVSVLDWQPGSLVDAYKAYGEHKWYFFTIREPSSSNKEEEPNRKVRVPGVKATWKATGSVVVIMAKGNSKQGGEEGEHADEKVVVGTKRVLIYHSSDAQENGKWSMHEYILEGHGKIGQYALCSIQRKQHSDTVANDGEGRRIIRRKRTKATDVDPGMTKKKRQRASKAASAQPEGVQLQQQEIAPAEAPLKPKSRTRKAATKRKNSKPSAQTEVQQQKQAQHLEVAPVSPAVPPLAPPHQQAPAQTSQQEQNPLAARSAPVLTALPQQGYPSHPDGIMLGASFPMHEEDTLLALARSFQCDGDYDEESLQRLSDLLPSFTCNEIITDRDAQYQLDQEQRDGGLFGGQNQHVYPGTPHFFGNITLNDSSWVNDHGQIYQEIEGSFEAPGQQRNNSWVMRGHDQFFCPHETGGSVGAPDQQTNNSLMHGDDQIYQPTNNALCYDQPYEYQMHVSPLEQAGYFSSDQFSESVQGDTVASGSDDDMGLSHVDYYLVDFGGMSDLPDNDPQGCDGTLDRSDPEVLQSKDEPQLPCGEQQHTANAQVCDGTPLDCYVPVFRPQSDEAVRGGSFTVLGR